MTPHPDSDALSAFFDGETGEWEDHVEGCAECRERLAAFDTVRGAVAAPVALPDAHHREAAVTAAMATVLPDRRSRRVPRWGALAGIGAVAAGLIVGAVVVTRGDHGHTTSTAAAQGPVSGNLVEGGDLGEVADAQGLHDKLQPSLGVSSSATKGQAAAGDRSPMAAAPAAGSATATTGTSAAASGTALAGNTVPAKRLAGRHPAPCEAAARSLQPGEEVLTYVAEARWQGTPAEVLGFSPADARASSSGRPAPTRVYVLARSGCRLLAFQSYAP